MLHVALSSPQKHIVIVHLVDDGSEPCLVPIWMTLRKFGYRYRIIAARALFCALTTRHHESRWLSGMLHTPLAKLGIRVLAVVRYYERVLCMRSSFLLLALALFVDQSRLQSMCQTYGAYVHVSPFKIILYTLASTNDLLKTEDREVHYFSLVSTMS
jgi:hypothetical protein